MANTTTIAIAERNKTNPEAWHFANVTGLIVGDFLAVTPCQGYMIGPPHIDWAVTHVPTGWAVKTCVPTRQSAIRLAENLQRFDWEFHSPKSPKFKRQVPEIIKVIKQWVQNDDA